MDDAEVCAIPAANTPTGGYGAQADMVTEIQVVATYEDGVHVLRPIGIPIEVRRWRDGPDMMWDYIGYRARLTKLGPPETNPDDVASETRS